MIYIPDQDIERFLLEDIAFGDLTTRNLGIAKQQGTITFTRRNAGRVSGIRVVRKILERFALNIDASTCVEDGEDVVAHTALISAYGNAQALHQAWKVSQNVLEWTCGVADSMAQLVQAAQADNPHIHIACTRKSIPGTKLLAAMAVLDGGGIMHRCGTAETILLFANHRRFLPQPFNWKQHTQQLRNATPEKKIVLEADTVEEAINAMEANPDIIQLDKFTPEQIKHCLSISQKHGYTGQLAAAGGINLKNIALYAATGIKLIVTSSPYYSQPADIKVTLEPK